MSRIPLGKVLLRNVIRHTDAHNKIQEESEMWKIREMEKQSQDVHLGGQKPILPNCSGSRMRSDGFDEGQHAPWKARNVEVMTVAMEEDLRHARYWNKKLYECEANMPDRWGHSGYKELYPEEFATDSDQERDEPVNGKRKSQGSLKLHKRKKAKKSHKKKQKKKSHKKKKKKKQELLSTVEDSSQESECSEGEAIRRKKKRHKKDKKTSAKAPVSSSSGQDSDSSKASSCLPGISEDSGSEKQPAKRRKHPASMAEKAAERTPERRNKRKNWKVAADENSEDSSDED